MKIVTNIITKIAFKLSGESFVFGRTPVIKISEVDDFLYINTMCLPYCPRKREISLNISPFENFKLVKMVAYDNSYYSKNVKFRCYGFKLAYWYEDKLTIETLEYLPDTKKTFSTSVGGYSITEDEMQKLWEERLVQEGRQFIDVLPYVSKPKLYHRFKFKLAEFLIKQTNKHTNLHHKITPTNQ